MSWTTVRRAPMNILCARPRPCQRAMPIAMSMRPKAHARSNHDTSTMERLAVAALWTKCGIALFLSIEESANPRVGCTPEHVNGAAAGDDTPTLQHHGPIARARCSG